MKPYTVEPCSKKEADPLLMDHHYIHTNGISKGFRSGDNFGLYPEGEVFASPRGVCIFTGLPVPELAVGAFGLERHQQGGLFELSRLVLHPEDQSREHNLASWFVARAIKQLRSRREVRAIISYADNDFHSGVVYAASNFIYCGLTAEKFDYINEDGSIASRGTTKWKAPRTRKHRFVKMFDKHLELRWKQTKWNNERATPCK